MVSVSFSSKADPFSEVSFRSLGVNVFLPSAPKVNGRFRLEPVGDHNYRHFSLWREVALTWLLILK